VVGSTVDIGADELYSCDEDYSEDDFHNDLDWNADGAVNLYEFSKFQRAWLSHDPNDPAWLADPNLADPNLSEGWYEWKYVCNLDDTGDSQYTIDLADLEVFWSDTPWLWEACWRENYLALYGMMAGGGGEEMLMAESVISVQTEIQLEESPVVEEISIEEQILSMQDCIAFLEQLWLQEPDIQQEIDPETWKEFMDAVYQGLLELQYLETEGIQME
jgi:hypothetical protein